MPNLPRSIPATLLSAALFLGCSSGATIALSDATNADDAPVEIALTDIALFDSSSVHDIDVSFDDDDYDDMIETFSTTGEKDWIEATVVIDGISYENAGLRLKGNSSLFSVTPETSGSPEDLPWLIRLDKYIDGQTHQGYGDIVIRSNSTETALNEALAQEMLELTGLASQQAIATAFTVNGGDTELRLALEHPDEVWDEANFGDDGLLYKADSEGDYSYRGDDPDAYIDVFDQKAGDDDLEPLTEFLDFINNSDDATFAAELDEHLDTDAFATYLAYQDLIGNDDDINGRGNNSYLHYDAESERMTVVNWDLNLAFNTANVGGGGAAPGGDARPGPGALPGGDVAPGAPAGPGGDAGPGAIGRGERPALGDTAQAGPGGAAGPGGQSNVLVDRFLADETFSQMYAEKLVELTELMYTSGALDDALSTWVNVLSNEASDLVDAATIDADAAAISAFVAQA